MDTDSQIFEKASFSRPPIDIINGPHNSTPVHISFITLVSLIMFAALFGHAVAITGLRVSEAAYSASPFWYVCSTLSSYSIAIAAAARPTVVNAPSTNVLAPSVPRLPSRTDATTGLRDGELHDAQPAPDTPSGDNSLEIEQLILFLNYHS
jgi:hypothetical protein